MLIVYCRKKHFVNIVYYPNMKEKILFLFLIGFYLQGFAQLKKDDALLGFGMGYYLTKNVVEQVGGDYAKLQNNYFNGTVRFGYFMRDGLALGGIFSYDNNKEVQSIRSTIPGVEENTDYIKHSKLFSVGPFLRGYKVAAGKKIAFFLQLDALYQGGKTSGVRKGTYLGNPFWGKDSDGRKHGFVAALHPGFVWFIRERMGVEVSFGTIGYNYEVLKNYWKGKATDAHPSSSLSASFGLNTLNLGLCFYLCERKS